MLGGRFSSVRLVALGRGREHSNPFNQSERHVFRDSCHNTALVVCTCCGYAAEFGDPVIWDETLEQADLSQICLATSSGIGIHTGNALRGYALGRELRALGATVVFGGIHPTLYPEESFDLGGAHATVKGDGDVIWARVLRDCKRGQLERIYEGGRVAAEDFKKARWDLIPDKAYMWASVQTVRGCPKHCSFCSVWRTDGQKPRQRSVDAVIEEIVELRRKGFRFIALADDNFYPVSLTDIQLAERQNNARPRGPASRHPRRTLRTDGAGSTKLPKDMVFFTQITMEAAEDSEHSWMQCEARNIKGALVGVEAVTPEGLKDVYKDFNCSGERAGQQAADLQRARGTRARLLHLRPAHRPRGHFRGNVRSRGESGCDVSPSS